MECGSRQNMVYLLEGATVATVVTAVVGAGVGDGVGDGVGVEVGAEVAAGELELEDAVPGRHCQ